MSEHLTIGELARAGGVGVETIRYYERRGLIPEPPRNDSGYRQYGDDDIDRIRFIKRAQGLGFTLNEVERLLELRARPAGHDTAELRSLLQKKADELLSRVRKLERMSSRVQELIEACPVGASLAEYRRVLELDGPDTTPPS